MGQPGNPAFHFSRRKTGRRRAIIPSHIGRFSGCGTSCSQGYREETKEERNGSAFCGKPAQSGIVQSSSQHQRSTVSDDKAVSMNGLSATHQRPISPSLRKKVKFLHPGELSWL